MAFFGAGRRTRTPDLLITNQLHYQLCYAGTNSAANGQNRPVRAVLYEIFYHTLLPLVNHSEPFAGR